MNCFCNLNVNNDKCEINEFVLVFARLNDVCGVEKELFCSVGVVVIVVNWCAGIV